MLDLWERFKSGMDNMSSSGFYTKETGNLGSELDGANVSEG